MQDGLASVQLFEGPKHALMIVQTRQGAVLAVNADTGDLLWRTQVGQPYWISMPVAVNKENVFACRRELIFALDRDTGKQQLYRMEKDSGLPLFGMPLEGVPSAGLEADDGQVYVPLSDRVIAYAIPPFRLLAKAAEKGAPEVPKGVPPRAITQPSPQLLREWAYVGIGYQILQPIQRTEFVCVAGTNGTFLTLNPFKGDKPSTEELYHYRVGGPIRAGMAVWDKYAYVASEDANVYAFDTDFGRLTWRFTAPAPIHHKVHATDRDVFVTPLRSGLHCLDRRSGTLKWHSPEAEAFLATNHKFVYAADRFGRLVVLDYERGTQLAGYDARDYVFHVPNILTDRIYLAAHDGTIICLHHPEFRTPLTITTGVEEVKPKVKPKEKDKKK
jgi:outer membrane protein assembly factor BamB